MEIRAYTIVDRTGWRSGEWDAEPDKLQWPDEATGLPCLVVRHPRLGHLCGYVGVAPGHPLHGQPYQAIEADIEVYGGLTYSEGCEAGEPEAEAICHVPGPGEPGDVHWFGFDCAHAGDHTPGLHRTDYPGEIGRLLKLTRHDTYRALAYVKAECARLAKQLLEAST